jgi:UDP-N-acetylglucosamine 1-carboxyvinyltransferase
MSTACLADGITVIHNAATEPEVAQLAEFLTAMGARIEGVGTNTVRIEGVKELCGANYEVPADRMEAGTFAVAAVITRGDVRIEKVQYEDIEPFTLKLREVGAVVDFSDMCMRVRCNARPMATDIMTMPHPGFPTDLQQPFAALLATAQGTSVVTENVYERRFRYVNELIRMGADIKQDGRTAVINGVVKLTGVQAVASDLRAGAALVCAALGAEGKSEISGIEHLQRGYENMVEKLKALGAQVNAVPDEQEKETVFV